MQSRLTARNGVLTMAELNLSRIQQELSVISRNVKEGNYDRAIIQLQEFKKRIDKIIEWLECNK